MAILAVGCGGDDSEDGNPGSPEAAGNPEPIVDGNAEDPESCDAQGINPTEGNTGTCVDEDGATAVVVNRNQTLKLNEFGATLEGVTTRETVPTELEGPLKAPGLPLPDGELTAEF